MGVGGLFIQAYFAGLVLYAIGGNQLGYFHPPAGSPGNPPVVSAVALILAAIAFIAIGGIIRNSWWAYFVELVLVWALVLAVTFYDPPGFAKESTRVVMDFPYRREATEVMHWIQMAAVWAGPLMLSEHLITKGVGRFRELRMQTTGDQDRL